MPALRLRPVRHVCRLLRLGAEHRRTGRRLVLTFCLAAILPAAAPAGWWRALRANDVDVITVTDVTDAGRRLPVPTTRSPVYYMIVNLGERHFGPDWTGEAMPPPIRTLRAMERSLVNQGYRLADATHPPTELLVCGWGLLAGTQARQALWFLGADKTDLRWLLRAPSGTSMLSARTGLADEIWEFAADDLFLGVLRAYTIDSLHRPGTTLLWETRFAAPAIGFSFRDSMPLMIQAAAPQFGRETEKPVAVDATQTYLGRVIMKDLRVLDDEHPAPAPPATSPSAPRRR